MAISFVLDTSAYSMFNRGDERLYKWISPANRIVVPVIVVGELRAGFAAGDRQGENETLLMRFLDAPNVEVQPIAFATSRYFADIFAVLRKAATPIGSNDIWIAAIAWELNLPILTLDYDFGRIEPIELIRV